ncbi:MAG: alpha/beta fold hydrolase [Armatimonadetes bacterium]|nr:alpha/beta fold hydrolase [Armatimonadota bacterium]
MPLLDMPLADLHRYNGVNPRPDDFDAYWDAALAEMRATDPCVTLAPSAFSAPCADCFDMTFTGVRGARIHAKLLHPKGCAEPHPAVVMFHGYSGDSGDWSDKLAYVARGYTVAALDCRGQGGLSEDVGGVPGNTLNGHIIRGLDGKPDDLLFRQIFLDCAELTGLVMEMPQVDGARVGVTGGSQGGGLTLACAALEPRIKLAAPVFPFLCDYQRVWEIDLAVAAYQELKDYFRRFDPRHEREAAIFTRLGYIDNQHLASRIRAEVLLGIGLMDTVCPPSSQFAAYNKITSRKSLVIYPDFGHEGLPGINDAIYQFMGGL